MKSVCGVLGVARSAVLTKRARPSEWKDGRSRRVVDDAGLVQTIRCVVRDLPSYGYRRVWALVRRHSEAQGVATANPKRVYRVMREHDLLTRRRSTRRPYPGRHTGQVAVAESNQRWCSDGFEFRCDNGQVVRATFALDCSDREVMSWEASTKGQTGDTVRDVMLAAVESRFGNDLPGQPIEWLTDNGAPYVAKMTLCRRNRADPVTTPVCSPQSNGMAESLVKTIKRDYVAFMAKPDAPTAIAGLAEAFEHYNEHHPHSALNYRSQREYRRRRQLPKLA